MFVKPGNTKKQTIKIKLSISQSLGQMSHKNQEPITERKPIMLAAIKILKLISIS